MQTPGWRPEKLHHDVDKRIGYAVPPAATIGSRVDTVADDRQGHVSSVLIPHLRHAPLLLRGKDTDLASFPSDKKQARERHLGVDGQKVRIGLNLNAGTRAKNGLPCTPPRLYNNGSRRGTGRARRTGGDGRAAIPRAQDLPNR
jgi:hypothetical protein